MASHPNTRIATIALSRGANEVAIEAPAVTPNLRRRGDRVTSRLMSAALAAVLLLLTVAVAMPTRAQSPNRIYRLGHLAPTTASEQLSRELLVPELAKLGFVEGRNLVVEWRVGDSGAQPGHMRDLLAARPDAIVAVGPAAIAAGAATRTVPIVGFGADAVELGLAASFARPGGNVTGVVILAGELDAKRLDLLRDALPGRRRVAALLSSTSPTSRTSEREMRAVAASAAIELLAFNVATAADYKAAFAAMRAAGVEALVIGASPQFFNDMKILAALALEVRLPTICEWAINAQDGCLIGYGPDRAALRRRNADQVARIFRGTAPGDIPIELPTVFELAINLKIAHALDLELPPALVTRADEVIE
jgi:putative ABC transport system substrate-binding protein